MKTLETCCDGNALAAQALARVREELAERDPRSLSGITAVRQPLALRLVKDVKDGCFGLPNSDILVP